MTNYINKNRIKKNFLELIKFYCPSRKEGKIAKFHVEREHFTGVHFDAYGDGGVFAPFSHDGSVAPEPATLTLLGIGLFGIGIIKRRK